MKGLNKSSGNMYPFVTHTWNPIKGKCPHGCVYCYMNGFPQKPLRLDKETLNYDLGKGNTIFVGSGTDMWANGIEAFWVDSVLKRCREYPENTYLFQSKNPKRFEEYHFTNNVILCTTIETNRDYPESISKAPTVDERFAVIAAIGHPRLTVTIEPIMDFDLDELLNMIMCVQPEFVSIGADSKRHNLPEPTQDKVEALLEGLQKITKVKIKENLARLRPA